jgi:hypothetical protein
VAHMAGTRSAHRILVGKSEWRRLRVKPAPKWEGNTRGGTKVMPSVFLLQIV